MPAPSRTPPSEAMVEFGRRVRELRLEQGMSQEALAARCGLHWTFVGQIERAQRSIRLENILRVAAGLQVEPGKLMDDLPLASV